MSTSIDDYDDLANFVSQLMGHPRTSYFRGVKVRCEESLGMHRWTVYGPKTLAFSSDVGWDEEDYVTDRLIRSGMLPIEQY